MRNKEYLPNFSLSELYKFAIDDDWKRREQAGFELRARVEKDHISMLPHIDRWLEDPNDRIRRAAVLACMVRKKYGTPEIITKILVRIGKVLNDDSLYVRKCTGPFVLGYLGYTYPEITLPQIKLWVDSYMNGPKYICWNLASAFSQALGRRYPDFALEILPRLAQHNDKFVQRAVIRSICNVAKVKRDQVLDLCKQQLVILSNGLADQSLERILNENYRK